MCRAAQGGAWACGSGSGRSKNFLRGDICCRHISVYRQKEGGFSPATWETAEGTRLAVWQTGLGGLDWLDELVKADKAIYLGGNGYPNRYTATAEFLLRQVMENPPKARDHWLVDAGDIVTSTWVGKTATDPAEASQCSPVEWLLVEAWDES